MKLYIKYHTENKTIALRKKIMLSQTLQKIQVDIYFYFIFNLENPNHQFKSKESKVFKLKLLRTFSKATLTFPKYWGNLLDHFIIG